jgi:hypothetical protein
MLAVPGLRQVVVWMWCPKKEWWHADVCVRSHLVGNQVVRVMFLTPPARRDADRQWRKQSHLPAETIDSM